MTRRLGCRRHDPSLPTLWQLAGPRPLNYSGSFCLCWAMVNMASGDQPIAQ